MLSFVVVVVLCVVRMCMHTCTFYIYVYVADVCVYSSRSLLMAARVLMWALGMGTYDERLDDA